jgi:hypothetical protein
MLESVPVPVCYNLLSVLPRLERDVFRKQHLVSREQEATIHILGGKVSREGNSNGVPLLHVFIV